PCFAYCLQASSMGRDDVLAWALSVLISKCLGDCGTYFVAALVWWCGVTTVLPLQNHRTWFNTWSYSVSAFELHTPRSQFAYHPQASSSRRLDRIVEPRHNFQNEANWHQTIPLWCSWYHTGL